MAWRDKQIKEDNHRHMAMQLFRQREQQAGLAVFHDQRTSTIDQLGLQAQVDASPRMIAQGKLSAAMQRQAIEHSSHGAGRDCSACAPLQLMANKVVQLKCKICGAKSHSTSKCPKATAESSSDEEASSPETESGGRGLTKGNRAARGKMEVCIEKLDPHGMYGSGAKSLVGGKKGKPSGLKDTSARIDRQGEGNVQFQVGGVSHACVIFSQETDPKDVIAALHDSFDKGEIVRL